MPARRRFPGSESDENFSVLIDSGDNCNSNPKQNNNSFIDDDDDKKKYATANVNNRFFGVSSGLTKLSSNIGNFLQQQIVQASSVNVENIFFEKNPIEEKRIVESKVEPIFDDFEDTESEIVIMASRDRTGEFVNAIRSMQGRNIARAVNIKDPRKATQLQTYSEFMMIAKHIGKNIASTYSKLEKLTLCKFRFTIFMLNNCNSHRFIFLCFYIFFSGKEKITF